jgi:hypothetical protein
MKGVIRNKFALASIALIAFIATAAFDSNNIVPPASGVSRPHKTTSLDQSHGEDWWIRSVSDFNGDGVVDGPTPINSTTSNIIFRGLTNEDSYYAGEDNYGVPGIIKPITEKRASEEGIANANEIVDIGISEETTDGLRLASFTYASKSLYPTIKKYRRRPRPNLSTSKWSGALVLSPTLDAIRDKLTTSGWKGPYRLHQKDSDKSWTKPLVLSDAIPAIKSRLKTWNAGKTLWIKSHEHSFILAVRIIKVYKIIDLANTTTAIDKVYTALKWNFTDWGFIGTFSCRRIAGSSSWSQHAWGNAIDFTGSTSKMNAMTSWLAQKASSGQLPISQIIHNRQVWTPMYGWMYYSGIDPHYTHVHVSGLPYLYGTPPCAYW